MSDYTDFLSVIREYTARPDFSDALIDSFIRQAETSISRTLRVRDMLVLSDVETMDPKVLLPSDWREFDFVQLTDGAPLQYITPDKMYHERLLENGKYTIKNGFYYLGGSNPTEQTYLTSETGELLTDDYGNFLLSDPIPVEYKITVSYYATLPHFSATPGTGGWVYQKYYDLLLSAVLVPAFQYALEPDKAGERLAMASALISSANDEKLKSDISGSTLKRPNNRVRMR